MSKEERKSVDPKDERSEATNTINTNNIPDSSVTDIKPPKPPKPEEKPFNEFINEEFIPTLKRELEKRNIETLRISLNVGERPVVGGECWFVLGELINGRRFWLCFDTEKITSSKTICLAERGSDPSDLESFLIDEKKTTLILLTSRLLQRLNGQKWLGAN